MIFFWGGGSSLLAHHLAETLDDRVLRRVVGRVLGRDLEHRRHHALVLVQEVADLGRTLLRDEDDGNLGVRHKAPERLLDLGRRRLCGVGKSMQIHEGGMCMC